MLRAGIATLGVGGFLIAYASIDGRSIRPLLVHEEARIQGGDGWWSGRKCVYLQDSCATAGPMPGQQCNQGDADVWACFNPTQSKTCNDSMFSNACVGDSTLSCPDDAVRLECDPRVGGWVWKEVDPQPPGAPGCGLYLKCI